MWSILVKKLLPQALKIWPKYNKLPNLVTLHITHLRQTQKQTKQTYKIFPLHVGEEDKWKILDDIFQGRFTFRNYLLITDSSNSEILM